MTLSLGLPCGCSIIKVGHAYWPEVMCDGHHTHGRSDVLKVLMQYGIVSWKKCSHFQRYPQYMCHYFHRKCTDYPCDVLSDAEDDLFDTRTGYDLIDGVVFE